MKTLAPSDLAPGAPPGTPGPLAAGTVRVGGRVLDVGDGAVTLADGFARIYVELSPATAAAGRQASEPALGAGDLAVVEGTWTEGRLASARVAQRIAPTRRTSVERHGSETGRLVHRGVAARLRARARAAEIIRRTFSAEGFLEVDTPCIVPSPGLDLHLDAFEVEHGGTPSAGQHPPAFLITSPEYQMKRLLAGGVPRCFQLARCFRRGEVGTLHNPEFLMLEWYRAFAGVDEVVDDTARVVRDVARELAGGTRLRAFGREVDVGAPFERLSVGEAFRRHAGVGADEAIDLASTDEERFFRLLVERVEPALAEYPSCVLLVDYPAPFASLARLKPDDPRVCERFELYACGVELCNGFGELTDPGEQRARLERDQRERAHAGKPVYPIDERFLAALEEGIPPAAGNALGVDRLVALCASAQSVAEVQPFPWSWL